MTATLARLQPAPPATVTVTTGPVLIGITGYAGSGKSTVAAMFEADGWHRRKFAAPLKNMLRSLLRDQGAGVGTIEAMIEGDLKEVPSTMLGGKSPRHAMQALGTEWGRLRMSDTLWVDAALRAAPDRSIFDDVRFDNEAGAIRCRGGKIILVQRPGVGPVNNHQSERLVDFDWVIQNDCDLVELKRRVLHLSWEMLP